MAYKNIWDCQINTSWALVFCIYMCVCIISNNIGKHEEEEMCLPNKESVSL